MELHVVDQLAQRRSQEAEARHALDPSHSTAVAPRARGNPTCFAPFADRASAGVTRMFLTGLRQIRQASLAER
jgi:hypothetical protein